MEARFREMVQVAMFSGQLERLPRSGGWMIWVRKLMGWVLVGMAVHFIRPVLPAPWATILLALVALAAGLPRGPALTPR